LELAAHPIPTITRIGIHHHSSRQQTQTLPVAVSKQWLTVARNLAQRPGRLQSRRLQELKSKDQERRAPPGNLARDERLSGQLAMEALVFGIFFYS
jgi:hypothetical protein